MAIDYPHNPDWLKCQDYVVVGSILGISSIIGVYYGCVAQKQNTASEYLLGGKRMNPIPVSMSLIASFMSAMALLEIPAEVYLRGSNFILFVLGFFLTTLSTSYLFLPVFFKLQLTSAYEYLEKRFHKSVRLLASILVMAQMTLFMAIVVYTPSFALAQVTGMNVYVIVVTIFIACVFYTSLGGMKAVIWTGTFQVFVIFCSVLALIIKGTNDEGGFLHVWETAQNHSRIQFVDSTWGFDPRVRHSVWSVVGGYSYWLTFYGSNQVQIQRYLTVKKMCYARMALWTNFIWFAILFSACSFAGLVMFAKFQSCDPLTSKRISSQDQLMVVLAMDIFDDTPGLSGLFIGALFAGSMSVVSSGLNSLATIFLEDFLKLFCRNLKEKTATSICIILSIMFGVTSLGIVFIMLSFEGAFQWSHLIFNTIGGPMLGLFTLGMFFPWANSIGAFSGGVVSLGFMLWLRIGTNLESSKRNIVHENLSLSTEGCSAQNFTLISNLSVLVEPSSNSNDGDDLIAELQSVSYLWNAFIGSFITVAIGLLISFLTCPQDPRKLNAKLISPNVDGSIRWLFPKFRQKIGWDIGAKLRVWHFGEDLAFRINHENNKDAF